MRIGVNSGEVLVGALRAGGDYTAMGDVVNTASRLQTSADPSTVLVGEAAYQATRDVIVYESCGCARRPRPRAADQRVGGQGRGAPAGLPAAAPRLAAARS